MYCHSRGRSRGGFTLVEVLVALLISTLLAGVVFQMMSGQSRIVGVQSAKEEAQQNVRGALEVISSELRGTMPAGILSAEEKAITFMQPRMWGITCGMVNPNTVDLMFPASGATMVAGADATGIMLDISPNPAGPSTWWPVPPARAVANTVTVLAGPGMCANLGTTGNVVVVRVTSTAAIIGSTAVRRNPAMLYTMTRYDLGQTDGAWWVRRGTGLAGDTPQPLAGPVEDDKVGFTYFSDPATVIPAPVAAPATIRLVRVQVVTNSTQKLDGRAQRDSGAITVSLRN